MDTPLIWYCVLWQGERNEIGKHTFILQSTLYEKSSGGILRCMVWGLLQTTPNINNTIKLFFFHNLHVFGLNT